MMMNPFPRNITGTRLSDFEAVTDGGTFFRQVGNIFGVSSKSQGVNVTVEGVYWFFLPII